MPNDTYDVRLLSQEIVPTRGRGRGGGLSSARHLSYTEHLRAQEKDIVEELHLLNEFCKDMQSTRCAVCGSSVLKSFDIRKHVGHWIEKAKSPGSKPASSAGYLSAIRCVRSGCGAKTCCGCRKQFRSHSSPSWCCERGRVASIWMLGSFFDECMYQDAVKDRHAPRKQDQPQNLESLFEGPYGQHGPYGPHPRGPHRARPGSRGNPVIDMGALFLCSSADKPDWDLKQPDPVRDARDKVILASLAALVPCHPSVTPKCPLLGVLISTFKLSYLLDYITALFRNDSIEDAMKRYGVYQASLELVGTLYHHPSTKRLITEERYAKKKTAGLLSMSVDRGSSLVLDHESDGTLSSVGSALENMQTVSFTILGAVQSMPHLYRDQEGHKTVMLCQNFQKLADRIVPSSCYSKHDMMKASQKWDEFESQNRVDIVDDKTISQNFQAGPRSRLLGGRLQYEDSANLGCIPAIIKEVASMRSSLPSGIFVKVGETRVNQMQALIIGPNDSPYAYGLFE